MKRSIYSNLISVEDYFIIHNPLYNSMIKVYDSGLKNLTLDIFQDEAPEPRPRTAEEKEFCQNLEDLKILVDGVYNEANIVNYRYDLFKSHSLLSIIMIPTRQCNFRCPYCYEEHLDKVMRDEVYHNTVAAVLRLIEDRGYKHVNISWFGGEPMLEYDKIIRFMNSLKQKLHSDITLTGQMTTNGYLLTKEKMKCLIDANVTNYQITVDGLSHTHDQTRYLVGKQGTWETITQNLQDFKELESNFKITIRTNMTEEIVDSADEWQEYLAQNFKIDKRYNYHFETVKDLGGYDKSHMYDRSKMDPTGYMLEKASARGLSTVFETKIYPFSIMCYAADPDSIVIDFDGKIKKCTVALDSDHNYVGQVDSSGITLDEKKFSWWTHYNKNDTCQNCSVYPICYGKKCPTSYFNTGMCDTVKQIYENTIRNVYA